MVSGKVRWYSVLWMGVALGKYEDGDAVKAARTEYLDDAMKNWPFTQLKAHGKGGGNAC